MNIEFKFAIGDIVTHKAMVPPHIDAMFEYQRLCIMGRVADECPGGVQLHYRVRAVTLGFQPSFTLNLLTLHEEELVPVPVKPAKS